MVGEVRERDAAFRGNKMMKNATVESMVVEDSKEPEKPIDREKVFIRNTYLKTLCS